ncbi:pilus assembly protein [Granulosicoccaceae sp. 1_MG-2023]|nr:pilus assembly protein [Granulosicoccaceae sp. 1_MG-2023]
MKHSQSGLTTIEFAMVAGAFFLMLFAMIEVARAGFVWNTLDTVTRRAARVAAVCPPNHSAIYKVALFGSADSAEPPSLLSGFTQANLKLEYLDEDFDATGGSFPIAFVRASVVDYQHKVLIPGLGRVLDTPSFSTTLPVESLGYQLGQADRTCFGTSN